MRQAEANVETWKQRNGWYNKQDVQTQTEQKQQQAWFAESAKKFAESTKKQVEQRKLQTKYPWKSTPLPSTFQSSPENSRNESNGRRFIVLPTIGLILV